MSLRKGFHFTEDDLDSWQFLVKNKQSLSDFYARYNAELLYDSEGFIYLSAFDSLFKQQKLRPSDMKATRTVLLKKHVPCAKGRIGTCKCLSNKSTETKAIFPPDRISSDST